jgi:predicted anti-sigma-YlaC factor YlaD
VFLWFQAFSLKVECSVSTAVSATKLFNKPPLVILNGTSNSIGLHNEHSLFQRISIHLHYEVKASKHLASLLKTDWQRERQAGCVAVFFAFVILILSYLIVLRTSFLRIPKTHNRTSLQVWHTNVLHFCSFCKPTFSGATREWDALYYNR